MRLSEIEKKAHTLNIKDIWKYPKKELIKTIQKAEGNFPCFGTARNRCDQTACCWRNDCLK